MKRGGGLGWGGVGVLVAPNNLQALGICRFLHCSVNGGRGVRAKGTSGSCTAFRKAGHASIHTSRN